MLIGAEYGTDEFTSQPNPELSPVKQKAGSSIAVENDLRFFELTASRDAKLELIQITFPARASQATKSRTKDSATSEILDLLAECDRNNIRLPTFVITHPSQVPQVPESNFSILLGEIRDLKSSMSVVKQYTTGVKLTASPDIGATAAANNEQPICTVIVEDAPCMDPLTRLQTFGQLQSEDGIQGVRQLRNNKLQVKFSDVVKTKAFCSEAPSVLSAKLPSGSQNSIKCKLREEKSFGIIRGLSVDVDANELVKHNPGLVEEALRFGQSETVRLTFKNKLTMNFAMSNGIKLGYDFFRVTKYKEAPRRCFRCQSYDHLIENCKNSPRCSRCAGPHTSNKDTPCNEDPKCVSCEGSHVCFSLTCPKLREILKNKSKQ